MSEIQIYYKRKHQTKWHNITYKTLLSEFDNDIQNKQFTFDLVITDAEDEDGQPIILDTGDSIVLCNEEKTKVFGDVFAGYVLTFKDNYFIKDENELSIECSIKVMQHDFSTDIFEIENLSSVPLGTNLNTIFQNTSTLLGGVLSDGTIVPKYKNYSQNLDISPIKIKGKQLNLLAEILKQVGYNSQIEYRIEPNLINNLRLIQTIAIFDGSGYQTISPDWIIGITLQTLIEGRFANPAYDGSNDEILVGEKLFTYEKDASTIKNWMRILAKIKNLSILERYTEVQKGQKDTFNIGKSYDVFSVAIKRSSSILEVISETQFNIEKDTADSLIRTQTRLNNNGFGTKLKCVIIKNGTEIIRECTISAQTITLTNGNIASLNTSDTFQLIGGFDVLPQGLTSYPSDGNGYVIKTIADGQDGLIKFNSYEKPSEGSDIVIYHYPVSDSPIENIYRDSIAIFGVQDDEQDLPSDVTLEELELIENELKKLVKELETITFISYRPTLCKVGWSISVNLPRTIGNFIANSVKGKILSEGGFYAGIPLIEQNIELSSYRNNIVDILAKLKNRLNITKSRIESKKIERFYSSIEFISTLSEDNFLFDLFAPVSFEATNVTDKSFTLKWQKVHAAESYIVEIYTDPEMTTTLLGYTNLEVGNVDSFVANGFYVGEMPGPFYVRVKAKKGGLLSPWSNQITLTKQHERYYFIAPIDGYSNIWTCRTDGSDMRKLSNFDFSRRAFHLSVSQTHDLMTYTNTSGFPDEFGALQLRFNNKLFSDEKYTNVEYGYNARSKSPICVLGDKIYSVKKDFIDGAYNIIQKYNTTTNTTSIVKITSASEQINYIAISPNERYLIIAYYSISYTHDICIFDLVSNTQEIRTGKWGKIAFFGNNDDFILCNTSAPPATTRNKISNSSFYNSVILPTAKYYFVCQIINNDTEYLTIELGGGTWIGRYNVSTLEQISLIKVSGIEEQNYNVNHVEMASSSPISFESQFPKSIYVENSTTDLNYGYIFDPQYKDDFTDYTFNNQKGVSYSENGNPSLGHPHFSQDDNDKWYIDFNTPYPTAFIIPDGNYELGSNSTIIMELDKNDTGNQTLICKWYENGSNGNDSSLLVTWSGTDLIVTYQDERFTGTLTDRYLSVSIPSAGFSGSQIVSVSLDCNSAGSPIINVVQNQTTKSYSLIDNSNSRLDIDSVHNTANNMAIGHRLELKHPSVTWAGNQFTGKLKSLAIIKNSLSDAQIKEIHRIKGYE